MTTEYTPPKDSTHIAGEGAMNMPPRDMRIMDVISDEYDAMKKDADRPVENNFDYFGEGYLAALRRYVYPRSNEDTRSDLPSAHNEAQSNEPVSSVPAGMRLVPPKFAYQEIQCLTAELAAANEKIARYESRLELVSYTDGNGVAHLMTEAEKIGMPDGIECRDETIGLLDEKIARLERALETHPCHTGGLEFDHNWKFVDDSFDHEYGTEVVHYFQCRFCEATKDVEGEGDCTIDG